MIGILARFAPLIGGNGLVLGLIAGCIVVVVMWDRGRINAAESRGGQKTIQKVQKQNAKATKLGRRAAAKSGRAAPVGVCPRGYRDC